MQNLRCYGTFAEGTIQKLRGNAPNLKGPLCPKGVFNVKLLFKFIITGTKAILS